MPLRTPPTRYLLADLKLPDLNWVPVTHLLVEVPDELLSEATFISLMYHQDVQGGFHNAI